MEQRPRVIVDPASLSDDALSAYARQDGADLILHGGWTLNDCVAVAEEVRRRGLPHGA